MGRDERYENRSLAVRLSEAELLQRGEELAAAELTVTKLTLKRTAISNDIKEQTETRARLAIVVDSGEEIRTVRCAWIEAGERRHLVRQDSGEVVEDRPAAKQLELQSLDAQFDSMRPSDADLEALGATPPAKRARARIKDKDTTNGAT